MWAILKSSVSRKSFCFVIVCLARTTAKEIFKALNDFIQENHFDGAAVVKYALMAHGQWHHSGLVKRVQVVVPAAVWQHCIIHWQTLATKKMLKNLRAVPDEAVNIVNLITSSLLHPLQWDGCQLPSAALAVRGLVAVPGQGSHPLMWFAWGSPPLPRRYQLPHWWGTWRTWTGLKCWPIFLISLMGYTLNTSLQGKECSVFLARYRVSAFRNTFYLWCARVEQGLVEMFSTLEDMGRAGLQLDTVLQVITVHLKGLHEQIEENFVEDTLANQCVWGPNWAELIWMTEVLLAYFWLSVETEFLHLYLSVWVQVFRIDPDQKQTPVKAARRRQFTLIPLYSASPHTLAVSIKDANPLLALKNGWAK